MGIADDNVPHVLHEVIVTGRRRAVALQLDQRTHIVFPDSHVLGNDILPFGARIVDHVCVLRVRAEGIHPHIRNLHGDVVVGELGEIFLGVEELQDVGVMNIHHAHVGTATESALLNRVRRLAEGAPKRDGPAGRTAGAADIVTGGAQFIKSKTGTAAGFLNEGGVLDRIENLVDAVAHREHEARAQHAHFPTRIHQGRTVRHETAAHHQLVESILPLAAYIGVIGVQALYIGNRPCDTTKEVARGFRDPALLVLLQVPCFQDALGVLRQPHRSPRRIFLNAQAPLLRDRL